MKINFKLKYLNLFQQSLAFINEIQCRNCRFLCYNVYTIVQHYIIKSEHIFIDIKGYIMYALYMSNILSAAIHNILCV